MANPSKRKGDLEEIVVEKLAQTRFPAKRVWQSLGADARLGGDADG